MPKIWMPPISDREVKIYSPEDLGKIKGVKLSSSAAGFSLDPVIRTILEKPCPFYSGYRIGETHLLYWVGGEEPLSLLRLSDLALDRGVIFFIDPKKHYGKMDFASTPLTPGLHLGLIGIIPDSDEMTWEEQLNLLPSRYRVSTAAEELAIRVFCRFKYDAHVHPEKSARTMDTAWDGSTENQVSVGNLGCPKRSIIIYHTCSNIWRTPRVGIGAHRILPA